MRIILIFMFLCLAACGQDDSAPAQDVVETPEASGMEAHGGQEKPAVLVDARWLHENLDKESVRILALGQTREDYQAAHIPQARFVDWRTDITDPAQPGRFMILSRHALEALLGRLGIRRDSTIVLYDTLDSRLSARMFWTLRYYGHEQIRLLDGGMQAWKRAGFAFSHELPAIEPAEYKVDTVNEHLVANRAFIETRLNDELFVLIDGRPVDQYTGDVPGQVFHTGTEHMRRGHIKGAHNVPWKMNFNDDGTFKSVDELRSLYQLHDATSGKTIVTYCNEGLHAAPPWFVLSELLGYQNVRLYDASMAEWANEPQPAMVTGKLCM